MQVEPVLYILARTDLESLNPGKLAAQVAHAANAFQSEIQSDFEYEHKYEIARLAKDLKQLYATWIKQTNQHFGTTIVLDGGKMSDIKTIIEKLTGDKKINCGVVHDPTYPVRDGEITHLVPLDTVAWVFCDKHNKKVQKYLAELELHW